MNLEKCYNKGSKAKLNNFMGGVITGLKAHSVVQCKNLTGPVS